MKRRLVCWLTWYLGLSVSSFGAEKSLNESKFICDFSSFNRWQDFIKFDEKPSPYLDFDCKSGPAEAAFSKFEIYQVGKISAGKCKGAAVMVGRVVDPYDPDGHRTEVLNIFGADADSMERDMDSFEINETSEGLGDWTFRAVKVGNTIFST